MCLVHVLILGSVGEASGTGNLWPRDQWEDHGCEAQKRPQGCWAITQEKITSTVLHKHRGKEGRSSSQRGSTEQLSVEEREAGLTVGCLSSNLGR